MFSRPRSNSHLNWPIVLAVIVAALAAGQIIRVNRPTKPESPASLYTPDGSVISGPISIAANDFYSVRIDLNRTAYLTGYFRTTSQSIRIEALVLTEENFELWKDRSGHKSIARTNHIPGGRLNLRLEPGTYFLVLDNRDSEFAAAPVAAEFRID